MNSGFSLIIFTCMILLNNIKPISSLLQSQHSSNIKAKRINSNQPSTFPNKTNNNVENRRQLLDKMTKSIFLATSLPNKANASNLPKDTGANLKKVGTIETLLPILQIKTTLQTTSKQRNVRQIYNQLRTNIPRDETSYKKLFDEYSTPVSYKQKFLDSNAFLVYYTKGFDGPNRPSIESMDDGMMRQTLQYGARNDSWVVIDELYSELDYLMGLDNDGDDLEELDKLFDRAIVALDNYLNLVPVLDLEEAYKRL